MMKHGRKFFVSVLCVVLIFALCIATLIVLKADGAAVLTAGISAIGVVAASFSAGNAYATSAHAKASTPGDA